MKKLLVSITNSQLAQLLTLQAQVWSLQQENRQLKAELEQVRKELSREKWKGVGIKPYPLHYTPGSLMQSEELKNTK